MNLSGSVAQEQAPPAAGASSPARRTAALGERVGSVWTFGVLLVLIAAFCMVAPNFHTKAAWVATGLAATEVMLLAVGEAFVIVSRGIDLSIGANLGLSGMVSGYVMSQLLSQPQALALTTGVVVAVAAGTAVGLVNGVVITRLNITPFVATLGMMGAATGATQLINGGQELSSLPSDIFRIGNETVAGGWIPIPVLVVAGVAAAAGYLLHQTRFGQHCFGIGSNPQAAERTGIDVARHTTLVYALAGACAGLGGYLVTAQLGAASVTAGQTDELSAIAAVVIGGVSLFGGRGTIAAAVIGTLIITVLQTGLVVAQVSSSWQVIAVGVVLVLAVLADQQRLRLSRLR